MSANRFLDANVILRHVVADDPPQSQAAGALFRRIADGEEAVWTTLTIVCEVVWVLSGRIYGHSRERVRSTIEPLLEFAHIEIEGKQFLGQAFDYYVRLNIDFIDALHAAIIEAHDPPELYSFDRDFDRIPGITRIEPGLSSSSEVPRLRAR